jgi:hypothetical protein
MRNLLTIMEDNMASYPDMLKTPEDVADYITDLDPKASYEDIREWAADECHECHFELRWLKIEEVHEGHPDANVRSAAKEKRYAKMTTPMPPLVLNWENVVIDGNHRYRIAKAKGATEIACYVPVEE